MNNALVVLGVILMVVGAVFTFFTLGFGIICTWPLLLVGFILFIVGAVLPEKEVRVHQNIPPLQNSWKKNRFCSTCGRSIPYDAKICPYCGKKIT